LKTVEFIKNDFTKPTPVLYKYFGSPLEVLRSKDKNTITDIDINRQINECAELTFTINLIKDRKIDYNYNELLVWFENTWFIIKEIDTDLNAYTIKCICYEFSTVLKGIYCETISQIGQTPETIFNAIMTATGMANIGFQWLGTDVDTSILRHLVADSETSVYENLVNMAKNFNGSIEFSYDISGIGYVYLRTKPITSHKFVKKEIDIKTLSITSSSTDIYSRLLATGYTDENNIVLDIQSVNNGNAILEDFSYYKAIGIPDNIIASKPQYQQLKTISDDTYTSANDLLQYAKEELAKYSKPQFTADCTIEDLSIFIDSPIEQPKINMNIKIIDKSINFIFDCLITGVERNYNNPLETKLTISNIVPYTTSFQSLQATANTVSQVVSTTNGVPTINVNYMSGILNALNTSIIGTVDNTTPSNQQSSISILFEDRRVGYPTFGAMGWGTKGLCIANELNADGTWNWKIFGNNKGFNASLIKTGILQASNGNFSFDLLNNLTHVKTQNQGTSDNQIASTQFVQNELNNRQNIIIGTITSAITVGEGNITLTINGLGVNSILVSNGNYTLNTAQIVGITNTATDTISVHYINGIAGNCKFNYTYSK
jgi:hypothetical protein